MSDLFSNAKILVCVGTGGVGKTTVAAALGALAAEQGRKVLVLTIDPSQRLKTTLGLDENGDITDLKHSRIQGRLAAAVINSKRSFDEFVLRSSKNAAGAEKILKNKLYIQLSTTLSGSQDFTALERLYSVSQSKEFDLIILDTPPAKHAMDFLQAPQKLTALFQDGIARWFRPAEAGIPFLRGILQTGTKQVLWALERLTGSEFIHELRDFFSSIEGWRTQLSDRTKAMHALLIDSQTQFFLVCSYDRAKLAEAARFGLEIQKNEYHLHTAILNRAFPEWLPKAKTKDLPTTAAGQLAKQWIQYFEHRRQESSTLQSLRKQKIKILELPEMSEDIRDLDGVFELVDRIKEYQ